MTVEEAASIIREKMDGVRPVCGYELTNYYLFSTVVDDSGNVIFDSSTYIVNKHTKECGKVGYLRGLEDWDNYINYGDETIIRSL